MESGAPELAKFLKRRTKKLRSPVPSILDAARGSVPFIIALRADAASPIPSAYVPFPAFTTKRLRVYVAKMDARALVKTLQRVDLEFLAADHAGFSRNILSR